MKILSLSCIHNDVESLMVFIDKLALLDFDVVVCPGDLTDSNFPKGFTRMDIGRLIVEELRSFKKPLLVVPGAWDKELIDYFEREKISLHGIGKIIEEVGFYGFGGARTPFNLPYEPSEDEINRGLHTAFEQVKSCEIKVQLTHAPPARTKLDIITSGAHVGSESVRKFIEVNRPTAAICAHIHEARGIDELGRTKIINSGRFPEGYCGLVTIKDNDADVKIINLI